MTGLDERTRSPHLCWSYDEPADRRQRMAAFLREGLERDEHVALVGLASRHELRAELDDIDGIDRLLATGAASLRSLTDTYRHDDVVVPSAQVRAYAAATDAALAAGFTGLRVAAEATPLVRSAAQLDAFARYEHLIDRYMVANPFAALCAYDRAELGDDSIAQLACMHQADQQDAAPFNLSAAGNADLALSGEVDGLCAGLFGIALDRADTGGSAGTVSVDATELGFIDHNGLQALDDHARQLGVTMVLRGGPGTAARLVDLLDLRSVRVQAP